MADAVVFVLTDVVKTYQPYEASIMQEGPRIGA